MSDSWYCGMNGTHEGSEKQLKVYFTVNFFFSLIVKSESHHYSHTDLTWKSCKKEALPEAISKWGNQMYIMHIMRNRWGEKASAPQSKHSIQYGSGSLMFRGFCGIVNGAKTGPTPGCLCQDIQTWSNICLIQHKNDVL